jgi:hypothetical protein
MITRSVCALPHPPADHNTDGCRYLGTWMTRFCIHLLCRNYGSPPYPGAGHVPRGPRAKPSSCCRSTSGGWPAGWGPWPCQGVKEQQPQQGSLASWKSMKGISDETGDLEAGTQRALTQGGERGWRRTSWLRGGRWRDPAAHTQDESHEPFHNLQSNFLPNLAPLRLPSRPCASAQGTTLTRQAPSSIPSPRSHPRGIAQGVGNPNST